MIMRNRSKAFIILKDRGERMDIVNPVIKSLFYEKISESKPLGKKAVLNGYNPLLISL